MKTKVEIISRLEDITSYYSFGRILGYIRFQECNQPKEQLARNLRPNSERLINSEISFLAGLWVYNVNLTKNWDIKEDTKYLLEVYHLMNELHLFYKPNKNTPFNEQLKEIAFYEGDEGYAWQFAEFATPKYNDYRFANYLLNEHNFDIQYIQSTFNKITKILSEQIRHRLQIKIKQKEYISPINAYTITKKRLHKYFTKEEQNIISSLSIRLGDPISNPIKDIADRNIFLQFPIIELPQERGFFIIDPLTLSISMNETPFYWIVESGEFNNGILGSVRGTLAENIVSNIIHKKFSSNSIYKNLLIKKTKSTNPITDIDILLIHKKVAIIFQIKSKRLTELSKKGDWDSINNDFNDAIANAYRQGILSINSLKDYKNFYSLKNKGFNIDENTKFFNICITLDQYPTISSISLFKSSEIEVKDIPLLAMSIYDLDIIFSLMSEEEIIDYICFRSEFAKLKIYGISEVYYLGAYIHDKIYGGIYLQKENKIAREYAILIDYIVDVSRNNKNAINSIEDIRLLLNKYPPSKTPITCL